MKTLLFFILFLVGISYSRAQDFNLPKSNSAIFLHSGKIMKGITLWRMDSVTIEYVIKGNLADVKTQDVSKIETPDFLIEFDEENRMIKKGYDVIVLVTHDSLRGFIQGTGDEAISYRPVGGDKVKRIMNAEVESYFYWGKPVAKSIEDRTTHLELTKVTYQIPTDEDSIGADVSEKPVSPIVNSNPLPGNPSIEISKEENRSVAYYQSSYERGISDANSHDKSVGWGGGGFLLGMTVGSPILSLAASTSRVSQDNIPAGVDEKLYRAGYENEIVKKRTKKAAAGAIVGKVLILIILIASL